MMSRGAGDAEGATGAVPAFDEPSLPGGVLARDAPSVPPEIDGEQAKGLGLPMLWAVTGGRGDAVLDLAKAGPIR